MTQATRRLRTRDAGKRASRPGWKGKAVMVGALALSALGFSACRGEPPAREPAPQGQRATNCVAPKTEQVARLRKIVEPTANNDEALLSYLTELANERSDRQVGLMIGLSTQLAALGANGNDIYSTLLNLEDPYREMALPVERAPNRSESRALSRIMRRASNTIEHSDGTDTRYTFSFRYDRPVSKLVITCDVRHGGQRTN